LNSAHSLEPKLQNHSNCSKDSFLSELSRRLFISSVGRKNQIPFQASTAGEKMNEFWVISVTLQIAF
jgi:hypothetical protein